jgi:hypothetical protein
MPMMSMSMSRETSPRAEIATSKATNGNSATPAQNSSAEGSPRNGAR